MKKTQIFVFSTILALAISCFIYFHFLWARITEYSNTLLIVGLAGILISFFLFLFLLLIKEKGNLLRKLLFINLINFCLCFVSFSFIVLEDMNDNNFTRKPREFNAVSDFYDFHINLQYKKACNVYVPKIIKSEKGYNQFDEDTYLIYLRSSGDFSELYIAKDSVKLCACNDELKRIQFDIERDIINNIDVCTYFIEDRWIGLQYG